MKKGQQLPRDAKGKLRRKVAGEPWPCPRCGVEKPLTVEYWKPSATDSGGLYGYCRACTGSRRPPSCLAVNGMKHCNGLTHLEGGADLPVEAFGPHATTPDKLQGHCRACQAAYRKTPKGRASSQKGSKKWIAKPENRVKSRASTERWRRSPLTLVRSACHVKARVEDYIADFSLPGQRARLVSQHHTRIADLPHRLG